MAEIRVFISSVQAEFADERQRLCDYIRQDALLGRFFIPFIFEELPAINNSAQEAYLTEAGQCDIYLGLFGERYGYEDKEGISPTEREYDVAHDRRNFPIPFSAGIPKILTHLNLMAEDGRLTNSALLLFAKDPQKFFLTSEVKCAQFYGTKVEKPIPFYQVFRGSIFELVDQAVGFVMGHIDARVGTRGRSASVDVEYELPVKAVAEAIVNAVVHRDYSSNASVQVMLFRDRLEILNPGTLPFGLSLSQLSKEHSSVPTNPILANPVYLAGYIERLGTGTTDIVSLCEQDGLPTPQFAQDAFFKVTIYRKLKSAESNNDKLGQSNKEENAENTFVNNAFGCIHSGIDSKQSNKESNIDSNIGNIESNIDSLTYQQQTVINFCYVPRTSTEIFQRLGLTRQTKNIKTYITDLVAMGFLRMIDPEHPRSKNQKYIKV